MKEFWLFIEINVKFWHILWFTIGRSVIWMAESWFHSWQPAIEQIRFERGLSQEDDHRALLRGIRLDWASGLSKPWRASMEILQIEWNPSSASRNRMTKRLSGTFIRGRHLSWAEICHREMSIWGPIVAMQTVEIECPQPNSCWWTNRPPQKLRLHHHKMKPLCVLALSLFTPQFRLVKVIIMSNLKQTIPDAIGPLTDYSPVWHRIVDCVWAHTRRRPSHNAINDLPKRYSIDRAHSIRIDRTGAHESWIAYVA